MRILICDDEQEFVDRLKTHIEKFMKQRSVSFQIDAENDPKKVMESDSVYQLAFLDIQMNEINGISLAKELKLRNGKVVIFFITSYNQYQDDAMDLRAFRFFEKPFEPERLNSGLEKAMEYIDESYVDFYVYTDNEQKKVLTDDVIYVERGNRKVTLVTTDGKYTTKESFDDWCNILQNSFFYRVHKSFLVNLHYVTSYKYSELIVQNSIRIPIASRRQADFHKFWFAYLRRR
ncbi:MAG: LytR/AlgR family response regulator transcription factor [Acutalibacteraceae bacterium]